MNGRILLSSAAACLLFSGLAPAQMRDNSDKTLSCKDGWNDGNRARTCDVTEQNVAASPALDVDGGGNGGVSIKGWAKGDILVRAKLETWAPDDARALALASEVRIVASGGMVRAEGPKPRTREGWSVSFEIFVPHNIDLKLRAANGGIDIHDVKGNLDFNTANGGVTLARVAGRVKGSTTNGGLRVQLNGPRFDGDSLDASTTNGGVTLEVPANYGAQLELATTNGGLHVNLPMTTNGVHENRLSAKLGAGGPLIKLTTTNGGVSVNTGKS